MKKVIVLLLVSIFLSGCNFMSFNKKTMPVSEPDEKYTKLRNFLLNANPNDIGIFKSDEVPNVWGVIMEMVYSDTVGTLVSLADGTTSLYFSNGAGIIGGGQHAIIAKSTKAFIATAEKYYLQMSKTESFPLPTAGRVRFYVLTFSGVVTLDIDENELASHKHELSPLYYSGQEVITQLRIIDEARKK
jgi:hypothetical protein